MVELWWGVTIAVAILSFMGWGMARLMGVKDGDELLTWTARGIFLAWAWPVGLAWVVVRIVKDALGIRKDV